MKVIVIIPARYASTRFPGKPLKRLYIGDGLYKPLIQLSWESASKIKSVKEIFIATDDKRIQDEAQSFGAKVIMTSEDCINGTERCAEAICAGDAGSAQRHRAVSATAAQSRENATSAA